MAPSSASTARKPNSVRGSSPSRIGTPTIQNLSGGFSRNAKSLGISRAVIQSPVSIIRSTA